jgi:hypothetical protein
VLRRITISDMKEESELGEKTRTESKKHRELVNLSLS